MSKTILRHAAQQADTVGDTEFACQRLDCPPLGAVSDDHELDTTQLGQRLNHQRMALQRDEIADRDKGGPGES